MKETRLDKIETFACDGKLEELKQILGPSALQLEIDVALEMAIAYSKIQTAEYLLSLGGNFSNYNYQGVYYAAHNDEIEGLKFAISKGVDVNVNNGMLLNTSIYTATNTNKIDMVKWLIENGADVKYLTEDSLMVANRYGTEELKDLIKTSHNMS